MSSPIVPEVWIKDRFYFTADTVDEHESGAYGVPQEMVPAIASAVMDALAELDLSLYDVYLSGHDGRETDPDAAKLRALAEPYQYEEYDFPDTPYNEDGLDKIDYAEQADLEAQAERAEREDAILDYLDEPKKPIYFMSNAFTLHHDADARTNPIHFAGISPTSTIVVYDKALMDRWDPDLPGETFEHGISLVATQAELAIAVRALIRLGYRIEGEPYERSTPTPNN